MLEYSPEKKKPLPFRIQLHRNKAEAPKNTVTLDFKPNKTTLRSFRNQGSPFRTFYKTTDHPSTYRYQPSRSRANGRYTAFTDRDSVIGSPFSTLQNKGEQINVPILPSFDKERYKYLLNALKGANKLSEYKPNRTAEKKEDSKAGQHSSANNSPQNTIGSPRIVNMSADFQPFLRRPAPSDFENSFQKVFKNKRLLQKGRYHSYRQSPDSHLELLSLGDQELKVHQASIGVRKQKKTPLG